MAEILFFLNFKVDDEDDLLDDVDEDDENDKNETSKIQKSLPIMNDVFLICYARLIYNLNKLMESHLGDGKSSSRRNSALSNFDYQNTNNDQPIYCMKINMLYSQLSQFRPDYWSLVNGENFLIIKKIYSKIINLLKLVKDSINCLFQV